MPRGIVTVAVVCCVVVLLGLLLIRPDEVSRPETSAVDSGPSSVESSNEGDGTGPSFSIPDELGDQVQRTEIDEEFPLPSKTDGLGADARESTVARGFVRFRAVDASTQDPLIGVRARFMSETRVGSLEGRGPASLSPGHYQLSIRVPGYQSVTFDSVLVEDGQTTDLGDIGFWRSKNIIYGDVSHFLDPNASINVELHGWVVPRCRYDQGASSCGSCHTGMEPIDMPSRLRPVAPGSNGPELANPQCEMQIVKGDKPHFRFEGLSAGRYFLRAVATETQVSEVRTVVLRDGERRYEQLHLEPSGSASIRLLAPNARDWHSLTVEDEDDAHLVFEFDRSGKAHAEARFDFKVDKGKVAEKSVLESDPAASWIIDRPREPFDILEPSFSRPQFAPLMLKAQFTEPSLFVIEGLPETSLGVRARFRRHLSDRRLIDLTVPSLQEQVIDLGWVR